MNFLDWAAGAVAGSLEPKGPVTTRIVYVPVTPWCDCATIKPGFTKQPSGAWVRPCCFRPTKAYYDQHGNGPVVLTAEEQEAVKQRNREATARMMNAVSSGKGTTP